MQGIRDERVSIEALTHFDEVSLTELVKLAEKQELSIKACALTKGIKSNSTESLVKPRSHVNTTSQKQHIGERVQSFYRCSSSEHFVRVCTHPKRYPGRQCHRCGSHEHIVKDCPIPNKVAKEVPKDN